MGVISDLLRRYAVELNLEVSDLALNRFEKYAEILLDWNNKVNLTSIVEPEQIAIKHFLDSAALLRYVEVKPGAKLVDVGTGAGFPGVPVKILRPDIELTLIDSLNKRVKFLNFLLEKLNLEATVMHRRAEEFGRIGEVRETFDIATSRAVAPMNVLSEYCLPLVKVGGHFAALKSSNIDEELSKSVPAINILGGKIASVEKFVLPENNLRSIVNIKKISKTDAKYPRISSKIAKNPL